ncbi:MFS transporter [Paenibacillus radicis (ex Xue et al. 2023)]|uniref:MFS transporter n=1 Tax=Paenibacillus radicis (ex Xue et al. 2023) TaxID=2972489 RepID=A0ABT1YND6_9BACL|nr:MFS transporter [Paenibacillus radicis (ex Xue et al. 2023)]MCR8634686.1 MFS transporter [Paenibacillus radicis (ex Xue et al. 2023)]
MMQVQSNSSGKLAKALLLLGLSLGYFMVLLDMTVVSVALPAIRADLGGGIAGLQWVVNAYTIVFAGLLLSMGTIADKLGAKRVYISGLVLFLIASAISAAVPSLGALIGLRAILGVGGAALLPASLTLLAHTFPEPAQRARALGIWAAVTGIAMAAGPVIGGLLVDSLGWRSIFLLNVPLAVISLIMTSQFVNETIRNPRQSFDLAGQVSAITAIVAFSFALMEGEAYGWSSPVIWGAFNLALLCAIVFIMVEAKGKTPLLPLRLFRNSTVSAGMIAGMAINIGMSGILFILPLFFQQLRGFSAHMAGLALLPMMIPMAFNPIFAGRIVGRIGARIPMTIGFSLAALGTLLQVWVDVTTSYALTLIGLLLIGFGMSFTIPSLMVAVISSVPKEQTGAASGALNSSRQLGATLGVAILGSIVNGSESFIAGMHMSLVVTTVILFGGSILSFAFIGRTIR